MRLWVDVDDCLVLGEENVPNFELIGAVLWRGGLVTLWSGDHESRGARGMAHFFGEAVAKDPSLPKPGDIVVDDMVRALTSCSRDPFYEPSCPQCEATLSYQIDVGHLPLGVVAYTPEQFIQLVMQEVTG